MQTQKRGLGWCAEVEAREGERRHLWDRGRSPGIEVSESSRKEVGLGNTDCQVKKGMKEKEKV